MQILGKMCIRFAELLVVVMHADHTRHVFEMQNCKEILLFDWPYWE